MVNYGQAKISTNKRWQQDNVFYFWICHQSCLKMPSSHFAQPVHTNISSSKQHWRMLQQTHTFVLFLPLMVLLFPLVILINKLNLFPPQVLHLCFQRRIHWKTSTANIQTFKQEDCNQETHSNLTCKTRSANIQTFKWEDCNWGSHSDLALF